MPTIRRPGPLEARLRLYELLDDSEQEQAAGDEGIEVETLRARLRT